MRLLISALLFIGAVACAVADPAQVDPELGSPAPAFSPISEARGGQRGCGGAALALQVLGSGGPFHDDVFPGAVDFVSRLFDGATGAFPILSGTVEGDHIGFPLVVAEVDTENSQRLAVFDEEELKVTALGVPHNAPAPRFGWRSETIAFVLAATRPARIRISLSSRENPRFL